MESLLVILGAFSSGTTISTWLLLFSRKNLCNWRIFQVLKEQKSLTSKSCSSSKSWPRTRGLLPSFQFNFFAKSIQIEMQSGDNERLG